MMSPTPQDHILADQLAEFTDALLEGDIARTENMAGEADLQETVVLIRQTFGDVQQPDAGLSQRIRRTLAGEWDKAGYTSKEPARRFKRPDWLTLKMPQPAIALAVAAIIVVLFVTVIAPGSSDGSGLPATAKIGNLPIVLGGLIAGLVVIWLLIRDK